MDFIIGLPKVVSADTIFVIVDRLSKYTHFLGLQYPFTNTKVAQKFIHDVFKLHHFVGSIVSDWDKLLLSQFWVKLFRVVKTTLKFSSIHHPQFNTQIKVVNQSGKSKFRNLFVLFLFQETWEWLKWLSWAKYWFNTTCNSFMGMIFLKPFMEKIHRATMIIKGGV